MSKRSDGTWTEIPRVEELGDTFEFYEVDGIPVASEEGDVEVFRYDVDPPEPFSFVSLFNNGCQITREQFLIIVGNNSKVRSDEKKEGTDQSRRKSGDNRHDA
jgi:hypothetical protein